MDRRQFLTTTARYAIASTLAGAADRTGFAGTPAVNPGPVDGYVLPGHLPKKLSIGIFTSAEKAQSGLSS